jgi:hypothetical protein
MTEGNIKMLERIQALIHKAESTEHAEEADAFMAKAQELLTKYSLSEFDLKLIEGKQATDTIVTVPILISEPCAPAKLGLIATIARTNNCKVVRGGYRRRDSKNVVPEDWKTKQPHRIVTADNRSVNYCTAWVTGFSRDIDAITMLYTSMVIQIQATIGREGIPQYVNKGTYTSHFIQGFANAVRSRLAKAYKISEEELIKEHNDAGSDITPVIINRKKQVEEAHEAMWKGALRTVTGGYNRTSTGGGDAGRNAGAAANIGQRGVGGIGALGRGGN